MTIQQAETMGQEAANRAADLIEQVVTDAFRKGIDPIEHLSCALDEIEQTMPSVAWIISKALLTMWAEQQRRAA